MCGFPHFSTTEVQHCQKVTTGHFCFVYWEIGFHLNHYMLINWFTESIQLNAKFKKINRFTFAKWRAEKYLFVHLKDQRKKNNPNYMQQRLFLKQFSSQDCTTSQIWLHNLDECDLKTTPKLGKVRDNFLFTLTMH